MSVKRFIESYTWLEWLSIDVSNDVTAIVAVTATVMLQKRRRRLLLSPCVRIVRDEEEGRFEHSFQRHVSSGRGRDDRARRAGGIAMQQRFREKSEELALRITDRQV